MGILKNKWFILGNILLLLLVIPVTLFIVKQQTDLRSKAAPSTNLSFTPTSATIGVDETATFEIFVDPGQNVVSILELSVSVDPATLEIVSLEKNDTAFPVSLREAAINDGTASISMSTSNDIRQAIQAKTLAATLVVRGIAQTTTPAIITLDQASSQAFSLASADGETENVLAGAGTASVTVGEAGVGGGNGGNGGNGGTGGNGGNGGTNPSPTTAPVQNVPPVCTALTLDRSSTGVAPYTVIFTATGSDNGSNITKASFNFGDGPAMDVTNGGGIGTGSVNVQIAHTFGTAGTYNVAATLTDDGGLTSAAGSCTQTITVSAGSTGSTGGGTGGTGGAGGNSGSSGGAGGGTAVPTLPVTGTLETALMIAGAAVVAVAVGVFLFIL